MCPNCRVAKHVLKDLSRKGRSFRLYRKNGRLSPSNIQGVKGLCKNWKQFEEASFRLKLRNFFNKR